ncbi:MAG: photosynthetic complex assembly protein PuhC [Betaproteobacteria bacterium]
MSDPFADHPVPRGPLLAAGSLAVIALIAAAAVRLTGVGATAHAEAPITQERALRFADRTDGGVDVLDAASGRSVAVLEPGEGGFVRVTLRSLARDRKRQGIGAQPVFLLQTTADGRLTLEDSATGQRIDLKAFGPTNAGAFARLMSETTAAR